MVMDGWDVPLLIKWNVCWTIVDFLGILLLLVCLQVDPSFNSSNANFTAYVAQELQNLNELEATKIAMLRELEEKKARVKKATEKRSFESQDGDDTSSTALKQMTPNTNASKNLPKTESCIALNVSATVKLAR